MENIGKDSKTESIEDFHDDKKREHYVGLGELVSKHLYLKEILKANG